MSQCFSTGHKVTSSVWLETTSKSGVEQNTSYTRQPSRSPGDTTGPSTSMEQTILANLAWSKVSIIMHHLWLCMWVVPCSIVPILPIQNNPELQPKRQHLPKPCPHPDNPSHKTRNNNQQEMYATNEKLAHT